MVKEPLELLVGGAGPYDPPALASMAPLPQFKGLRLVIERRGFGTLSSYEVEILPDGGFQLKGGATFQGGELYFVYEAGVSYATDDTGYSNGFNYGLVISAFFGRLGWRASSLAGAPAPDADNATSRSGRYFNDFHALCSPVTFGAVLDNPKASGLQFNAELAAVQKACIMAALNGVLNEPELVDEPTLDFIREGEQNDRLIDGQGLFVGRRITPVRMADRAVQVDQVGLYFDGDITFPLYLYQEGRAQYLKKWDVTALANEKSTVTLGWILSFLGSNHLGGAYYLGYFQDDLGAVKAIDESRCQLAGGYSWRTDFIQAPVTGPEQFDRKHVGGSPWSHGLNVQISSFKDWTQEIVKKANLFDELVGLNMAATMVEKAIHTVRSNSTERALKDQLVSLGFMDLSGAFPAPDGPKVTGLRQKIERELKRVKKSFCPTPRGITYQSEEPC